MALLVLERWRDFICLSVLYLGSSGEGSCARPLVWAGLWAGLFSGLTSSLAPFVGGSSRQALTPSHCCAALRMARRRFSLMNRTHTHRGQRRILLSRTQQSNAQLMEPFCQYILSQAKSYLLPPLSLRYSMLLKIVWRLLIGLIGSRTLSELDLKLYMHVLVHSICFCYCSIFDLTAVGSYSSKTDTRTLTERGFLPPVIVLSWLSCSFDMLTYGMCHSSMQGWVSINS